MFHPADESSQRQSSQKSRIEQQTLLGNGQQKAQGPYSNSENEPDYSKALVRSKTSIGALDSQA
jgi:hypothetical protein